jgi:hypothetical protein
MAGTATMAGTGTMGTTVIGVTGKLGQIRAAALNEQVRAASFAKALLSIRQKAAASRGRTCSHSGVSLCLGISPGLIRHHSGVLRCCKPPRLMF